MKATGNKKEVRSSQSRKTTNLRFGSFSRILEMLIKFHEILDISGFPVPSTQHQDYKSASLLKYTSVKAGSIL
jgi:hypothetical protein